VVAPAQARFGRRPGWLVGLAAAMALPSLAGAPAGGLCETGRRQSPIDIVAPQRQVLPTLQFHYTAAPTRIVNDGHTVRVRLAGSHMLVGDQRLSLQQFHFHLPGGDRVQGEEFPMAMHWLHKAGSGQLVALVLLFRLGAEHPALAALLPGMPTAGQPERRLPDAVVDPAAWLPGGGRAPGALGYYAYDGSLTAPPCTEGVRWIVLKQVQTLSAAQLARLHRLMPDNARPVQPLHGRTVAESL
jgi:carbonic anhydrase